MQMDKKNINTDVLVIGGAGAGMRAAIEARSQDVNVTLVSKMPAGGSSSTLMTAGWFTCSTAQSEEELFRQVVHIGGYLNNQELVEVLARDVTHRIPELGEYGVPLSENEGREPHKPGHYTIPSTPGHPRGYSMLHPMRETCEDMGISLLDNTAVSSLLAVDGKATGAVALDLENGQIITISAKSTIIATGGGADAFERNNTPAGTTGDGFILAFNAGAELVDMELISFNLPNDLLDEMLKTKQPPDRTLERGIAHYSLGGIKIDKDCRTNVNGLFAAGEVTGGVFGAGRIGGSAMADIIVFGARAGKTAAEYAKSAETSEQDIDQLNSERNRLQKILANDGEKPDDSYAELRSVLWKYIGITKTDESLAKGYEMLGGIKDRVMNLSGGIHEEWQKILEARNILEQGRIIAQTSMLRKETRGNYWRIEYPEPDNDNCLVNITAFKDGENIGTKVEPVKMTKITEAGNPPIGQGCFGYL
ncbi:FAD-binding protein [Candidatus Poribacteria bacterium]|nr:FAD-binding protein [Candidatus Poribacteria bacterium]